VAAGFAVVLALGSVLLFTGAGESAHLTWRGGTAVPRSLSTGVTAVDDSIPVDVAPDITAWTGSELLTFGVDGSRNSGAVYEPTSGRWRAMSEIPFGTVVRGAGGVWTGHVWVVVGVLCDLIGSSRAGAGDRCDPGTLVGAVYEPGTDTWRTIDARAFPYSDFFVRGHSSSFGRGVGMLGSDAVFQILGQYYAFRPDSWDWKWLPQPPSAEPVACSVGRSLIAYTPQSARLSMLEPGATLWSTVSAAAPNPPRPDLATVCTGRGVFVYSSDLRANSFFAVARRAWIPVPPASGTAAAGGAAFTGGSVLFGSPSESVAYDLAARSWRSAPAGLTAEPGRVTWYRVDEGLYFPRADALAAYHAA
jgi:hypothetical protein